MRNARKLVEWSVYAPLIVLFLLSAELRVEGDTLALIHGAANARQCLVEWVLPCDRYVVHFPIFQYLVAVPLLATGLSPPVVAKVLVVLNLAFALATIGVFVRIGRAMAGVAGTHFALALLFSGYAIFYFFASFNEIAAFALFAALCAAVLLHDRAWIVFALALLCSITKEIAPPFVLFVYLAARVAGGDRNLRRETWSGVLRGAWPVLAGVALGIAINSAFNGFRYGSWVNVDNLRPLVAAPASAVTAYFWYLFASPAGGLAYAWLSLVLLAATLLFLARKDDGELGAVAIAIAIVAAANLGLAFWWSSFGWNSWGPRLTLPFLGAVGVLLVFLGRPLLQALRQPGRTWALIAVFLVVFVSLLPNALIIAAPGVFFGPMFAPGTMHALVPDASIVQKSGPEIVKMVLLEAYGRIVVIPATLEAAAKKPLVVVLAAAYAALAAWRVFKAPSDRLWTPVSPPAPAMEFFRARRDASPPEPGLETRLARADGAWVLALLLGVSSALVYCLDLPHIDLSVPLSYEGDSLQYLAVFRTILATGWYTSMPLLGAPFGTTHFDAPVPDGLFLLFVSAMRPFTTDPAIAFNALYIGGFLLVPACFFVAARRLAIPRALAAAGALAYTFLPFHFLRVPHLFYTLYFLPPLVVAVAATLIDTRIAGRWLSWRKVVLFAATGAAGVYYAFFLAGMLLFAGLVGMFATGERRRFGLAAAGAAIIAASLLANLAPNVIYQARHGANPSVAQRRVNESEIYGLKVVQLLLPNALHPVPVLGVPARKYNESTSVTEAHTSSLGLLGAAGFLLALLRLLARWRTPATVDERRLDLLAKANGFLVLAATVGGLGVLFSLLVSPQIRAWNRVSVVIAALALLTLLLELARWTERPDAREARHRRRALAAGVLLLVWAIDEAPQRAVQTQAARDEYGRDSAFVARAAAMLPAGASVYQVPYIAYPESPPLFHEGHYGMLRPYLQPSTLRWSHGAMRGRPEDQWLRTVAGRSLPQQVDIAERSGFSAIWVERRAYPDNGAAVERVLASLLGPPALERDDKALALYRLTPRGDRPVDVERPDKGPAFVRNAQGSERAAFFPDADPRLGTQVGTHAADGFRSTGAAGFLQWGPYATLAPGRYRAIWIGRLDRAARKPPGIVDVTSDAGRRSHAQAPLPSTPPQPGTLATLDFTLDTETPQMEFRLKVSEGTLATVERVELERR